MIAQNVGPFRIEVDEGGDYTNVNVWLGKTLLVAVDDFYAQGQVDEHHEATVYIHLGDDDPQKLLHYDKPDQSPDALARELADRWSSSGLEPYDLQWLMERVEEVGMKETARLYFEENK